MYLFLRMLILSQIPADLTIIPSNDDKPYINVRDKDGKTITKMDV